MATMENLVCSKTFLTAPNSLGSLVCTSASAFLLIDIITHDNDFRIGLHDFGSGVCVG